MLMVCLPVTNAIAQVEWSSRYVTLASEDQTNPSVAKPPNAGYTVVVWEDARDGATDIYAQMIESNTDVAMWYPIDGVPVCTVEGAQRNPRAAYDSLGGVIIVWEDFRDRHDSPINDTTVMDIYAHRIILSSGQLDANWSANPDGVPVCARTGHRAKGPVIVGTTDGAYIAWTDYRNSSGWPNYWDTDVYALYVLSGTATYPNGYSWTTNGIDVTDPDPCGGSANCSQRNPDITLDYSVNTQLDRYGVFIVYEDLRRDAWRIFASHIGADGTQLQSDLEVGVLGGASNQLNPRIAAMGATGRPYIGAAVTWEDDRDYQGTRWDVYAQNVTLNMQHGWTNSGEPVCTAGQNQLRPRIAARGDAVRDVATMLIVFEDYRDYATNGIDVYCNALDGRTGARFWSEATAAMLCDEPLDQQYPEVDLLDDFVVAWQDWREGTHADIYGNQLYLIDPTQFRWQGTGQAITRAKHDQTMPQVSGEVIVWGDGRRKPVTGTQADQRADRNIYAQKLGNECDLPTEMNWHEVFVKWNWGSDIRDHRFVVDSLGSMYAVWIENRPQDGGQDAVYVQKLDRDGVPKWYNGGVMVSAAQTFCEVPDICVDGNDGCYVTWNENGTDVMLAHLDYLGATTASTLDNPGGLGPRIVEDDAGGVILAYNDTNTGIRLRHYDVTLSLLDAALATHQDATAYHGVKLSKDRVGGTWLVWHDGAEYFGTAYDGAGTVLGADKLNGAWGGLVPWSSITGEFDIDTDYIPVFDPDWHSIRPYDCVISAIVNAQGGGNDVVVARLFQATNISPFIAHIHGGQNLTWNPSMRLISTGILHQSSQPAISADSTYHPVPSTQLGGGALIAWASTYPHPMTQDATTCVMTNRVTWSYGGDYTQGAFYNASPTWPVPDEVILDDGLDAISTPDPHPDIATVFGAEQAYYPDGPRYGVVSWTSDRYSGCTGPYAVRVQQVDYSIPNNPPGSQPKFWNTSGEDIAPLVGSVAQGPALLRTPWPESAVSAPNAIPALWNDTRSGSFCLLATKVYDHSYTRCWSKQSDDFRPPVAARPLSTVVAYPQPVSISQHGSVTLTFPTAEEGTVRVSLFDAMGRRIIPEEVLPVRNGSNHITLDLTRIPGLIPGVYMYSIEGAGVKLSRPVVFLR
jgi:hypothetical protein